jgi:prophage tail gpP-like protein
MASEDAEAAARAARPATAAGRLALDARDHRLALAQFAAGDFRIGTIRETEFDGATHGHAVAHDYGVRIFRPLVIHEPSESGAKKLQRRADFEVRTRVGRSRRLQYVVQGHLADENPAGPVVWLPNRLVQVVDKLLDVEDELLIERVQTDFANGGEGTLTTLDLVAPYAYDLLAPPPKKRQQPRGRKGRFVAAWG